MIVIVCVDDNMGLMFNKRRQSRDNAVIEKIIDVSKNSLLHMNAYSFSLFENKNTENIIVSEDFFKKASKGEYCFLEDKELKMYENRMEKIIIFKWNRKYPADFYFDVPSDFIGYHISERIDFKGNSHEKITMEIYEK